MSIADAGAVLFVAEFHQQQADGDFLALIPGETASTFVCQGKSGQDVVDARVTQLDCVLAVSFEHSVVALPNIPHLLFNTEPSNRAACPFKRRALAG